VAGKTDQERLTPQRRALLAGGVLLTGAAVWLAYQATHVPPRPVYSPAGYGGYTSSPRATPEAARPGTASPAKVAPVQPALEAYNRGQYRQAETEAKQLVDRSRSDRSAVAGREVARARWVLAFSAARRKDFRTARSRFAELKQEAAGQRWTLEDARQLGKPKPTPARLAAESSDEASPAPALGERPVSATGEPLPTLEEEAAYQHAVLTAALLKQGGGSSAELGTRDPDAEFVRFMREYPESPLVHAAVRRIARHHSGDVPKGAEAVWKQAMAAAQERQHARERERSLCGPEVLAEVLRRAGLEVASASGESAAEDPLHRLAGELGTDYRGTSLAALAKALKARGFRVKGLKLTWDGLWKITNGPESRRDAPEYLVALIQPGHYVLVEDVRAGEVDVWDPSANGADQPGRHRYSRPEWAKVWDGIMLRLDR
jgi:hypothetical protein